MLEAYARTYLEQGYAAPQVEQGLLQQGCSADQAAEIVRKVGRRLGRGRAAADSGSGGSHHSLVLILFPILAIAVLVGGYFFVTGDFQPSTPHVDREVPTPNEIHLNDILDNLIQMSKRNPEGALTLCKSIVPEEYQVCVLTVGRESSDPKICAEIDDKSNSDACYLEFIYDGHLSYCDKLQMPANIEYCETVKSLGGVSSGA